jgi:hypothetical protein
MENVELQTTVNEESIEQILVEGEIENASEN